MGKTEVNAELLPSRSLQNARKTQPVNVNLGHVRHFSIVERVWALKSGKLALTSCHIID